MIAVLLWIALGLGALLALLLLALALLLLVPVELDGIWSDEQRRLALAGPGLRLRYDVADRCLEVRVLSVRVLRFTTCAGASAPRAAGRVRARASARPGPRVSPRRLWRDRRRIGAALRGFVRRVRVRRFRARAVIASPDPAWTGWVGGMAFAGWGALPVRVRQGAEVRSGFRGGGAALRGRGGAPVAAPDRGAAGVADVVGRT